MKKGFLLAFVLLFAILAFAGVYNFITKTSRLDELSHIKYLTGTIDYFRLDGVGRYKHFSIKLNGNEHVYTDGSYFLAGFNKDDFMKLAKPNMHVKIGIVDGLFLYDMYLSNQSFVDINTIKNRLEIERAVGLLMSLVFIFCAIAIIKKN